MKTEIDGDALRITQQFRSGEAMTYEFRNKAGRLTLRVTGRGGDEGPPTEWGIEAAIGSGAAASVIAAEWGPTRDEALRAVGRSWNRKSASSGLAVDWAQVALAMTAVRAL